MTDVPDGMVLLCPSKVPACGWDWEVSPNDPDATLSEILSHLRGRPHYHDHPTAMRLLAKVGERR